MLFGPMKRWAKFRHINMSTKPVPDFLRYDCTKNGILTLALLFLWIVYVLCSLFTALLHLRVESKQ